MEQPQQHPPVERTYMRYVVGRAIQRPEPPDDPSPKPARKGRKAPKAGASAPPACLLELTVFHSRTKGRG